MAALAAITAVAGCTGEIRRGAPGEGTGRDAGTPTADGGPWVPRGDGGPGTDAGRGGDAGTPASDGGPAETDAGPTGACVGVTCPTNARCDSATGDCVCREGFVDNGSGCEAPPAGDPATRSTDEVCAQWRDGHVENARPAWIDDGTECGPGTMPEEAIADTVRRTNLFRWLTGLPPVIHNEGTHDAMMECAAMMSANGGLSHDPPMSWACWTAEGAAAAGRANIAWGYTSPASAIDGYMADSRTPSLGHRRWILSRNLGAIGIGFSAVGGRPGQCLGIVGGGGTSSDRAWSAYPNPGPAPIETTRDAWSFQAYTVRMGSDTSARVVRASDGTELPVTTDLTGGFGPPPTLSITADGWSATVGETYRVTITNLADGDITYEVEPVGC